MDLTTNSDYSAIPLLSDWFYNRDGSCSLHGKKGTFKNQRGRLCFIEDLSMTQTINRQSHTAEAGARSRFSPCKICGGQSGTWKGSSSPPTTSVCPGKCYSTNDRCSSSSMDTRRPYQEDKREKPGTLQKCNRLPEIGEHWVAKCLYFSLFLHG
jgi:hypothetical protein